MILLLIFNLFLIIECNFVCPRYWKEYNHPDNNKTKCIKPFYEMVGRDEAKRRCQHMGNGYDLMEIHSDFENFLVITTLYESGVNFHLINDLNDDMFNNYKPQLWFGAKRVPFGALYDFQYPSGCGIKDFNRWQKGQPNDIYNNEDCVYIIINESNNLGLWVDYQCDTKMYYMCQFEWDVSPPCNQTNYNLFGYKETNDRPNQVIHNPLTNPSISSQNNG